jgi:asparagine synthase (glutamine-hydrolysing)
MCGIAGFVGPLAQETGLARANMRGMLGAIRHRGPDQFGIYQDGSAVLGSARLSIIDLHSGQQPISNENGTVWIVFNGEIFNYVELRPDLEARGHTFRTGTDTEVLLHLYEEYGAGCLSRVNGQFAVGIWDARRQELFLARDRMGIHPLYYAYFKNSLVFASEVKAIFSVPGMSREIDPAVLQQVFVYWGPLPGQSIFRDVRELPAGHFLMYSGDQSVRTQCYWDMSFPTDQTPRSDIKPAEERDYAAAFHSLLADAVRIRLRSDVPVGAYLSGGIDSAMIARLIKDEAPTRLTTFSIAFDDPDFDERRYQNCMADFLGATNEVIRATHADIGRAFPDVIWHTEVPVMRTAPVPMFFLSKLVRNTGYKVALTGEGADELLAGYDIFKEAALRRFWARQPDSKWRPLLLRRLYSDIPALSNASEPFRQAFFGISLSDVDSPYYSHFIRWRNNARCTRFFCDDVVSTIANDDRGTAEPDVPAAFKRWSSLDQSLYLESKLFFSQYLLSSQGDRVAMAHSVECRFPFLDYRVIEFCSRLPGSLKLRCLRDKYLLRRLGESLLPAEIWQRPKRPYRAPIQKSFFGSASLEYVGHLLSPGAITAAHLFKQKAVERLVQKATSDRKLGELDEMALTGILSTQLVHQQFVSQWRRPDPIPEDDHVKICSTPPLTVSAAAAPSPSLD